MIISSEPEFRFGVSAGLCILLALILGHRINYGNWKIHDCLFCFNLDKDAKPLALFLLSLHIVFYTLGAMRQYAKLKHGNFLAWQLTKPWFLLGLCIVDVYVWSDLHQVISWIYCLMVTRLHMKFNNYVYFYI